MTNICFLSFSEDEDESQIDKLFSSGNNTPIHSGKYAHTSYYKEFKRFKSMYDIHCRNDSILKCNEMIEIEEKYLFYKYQF